MVLASPESVLESTTVKLHDFGDALALWLSRGAARGRTLLLRVACWQERNQQRRGTGVRDALTVVFEDAEV